MSLAQKMHLGPRRQIPQQARVQVLAAAVDQLLLTVRLHRAGRQAFLSGGELAPPCDRPAGGTGCRDLALFHQRTSPTMKLIALIADPHPTASRYMASAAFSSPMSMRKSAKAANTSRLGTVPPPDFAASAARW